MIRAYESGDTNGILDVWFQASLIAHPFLHDSFLEQERENIQQIYLPNTQTWVFQEENKVVGFISMMKNEIGAIFVSPAHHRKGIGRALLDLVKPMHPSLEVEVFKANNIGRAFYEKNGFQLMKEHIHDATGHPLLRLILDKKDESNT